jgi:stage V sporulation protein AD
MATIFFKNDIGVLSSAAIVGKKEGEGPLASYFDVVHDDDTLGEKTWEKSESRLQKDAVNKALQKGSLSTTDVDIMVAGDLLNQCIGSTYGLREMEIPFLGVYGACSTMAESLCVGSLALETGSVSTVVCVTSSHFCSAERQFRTPLEYGGQRTPTSQWTVTGSGAVILKGTKQGINLKAITIGKMIDLGIKDANNMGAAMAPAAADTIKTFLDDSKMQPTDFDLILTGDLGKLGSQLLYELLQKENIDIKSVHNDCGLLMFDNQKQDTHCGGSGCGCSATVLSSYIFEKMTKKELNNVLFVATGALLSPTSTMQGESIPSVAHLVWFTNNKMFHVKHFK